MTPTPDTAAPTGLGAQRRIRALMARAWSPQAIENATGIPAAGIRQVLADWRNVSLDLAAAVVRAYDQLWDADPPRATHAQRDAADAHREQAERHGWPPPMAWDDDTIDHPDGHPAPGWKPAIRTTTPPPTSPKTSPGSAATAATATPPKPNSPSASASPLPPFTRHCSGRPAAHARRDDRRGHGDSTDAELWHAGAAHGRGGCGDSPGEEKLARTAGRRPEDPLHRARRQLPVHLRPPGRDRPPLRAVARQADRESSPRSPGQPPGWIGPTRARAASSAEAEAQAPQRTIAGGLIMPVRKSWTSWEK